MLNVCTSQALLNIKLQESESFDGVIGMWRLYETQV